MQTPHGMPRANFAGFEIFDIEADCGDAVMRTVPAMRAWRGTTKRPPAGTEDALLKGNGHEERANQRQQLGVL